MPLAVIVFDFDPYVPLGERVLRWETLGLAMVILGVLALAALIAGRSPAGNERSGYLRRDDLLIIVVGIVPGAVIGGRIGYVLIHLDYYTANPAAMVDPAQGSLQLSVAVVLGAMSGAYLARLLRAPVGRWLHVAVVPLLLGLALGKACMALGGSGQGSESLGAVATAYVGAGPWGSIAPAVPAHASQLYEAGLSAAVVLVIAVALGTRRFEPRNGGAFLLAVGAWAIARLAVAFTWRDPVVLGPFDADQLISIAIVVGCAAILGWQASRARRTEVAGPPPDDRSRLEWPDPTQRRPIVPAGRDGAPAPPPSPPASP